MLRLLADSETKIQLTLSDDVIEVIEIVEVSSQSLP